MKSLVAVAKKQLSRRARATPVLRWALDYPTSDGESVVTDAGQVVQGWLLLEAEWADRLDLVSVVANWHQEFELIHPLEVNRQDVVAHFSENLPEVAEQRRCGFRFTVPHHVQRFLLVMDVEGQRWPMTEVRLKGVDASPGLKVLRGEAGWLFLDNDTNGSVDQFTGRMRLTAVGLENWRQYLLGSQALAQLSGSCLALLISPSKESVMGARYHPMSAQGIGPIDQLLSLDEAHDVVYPLDVLIALGDEAFIPTDSHWTHRGAMVSAISVAERLGLDANACRRVLAKDLYRARAIGGDLGNKLSPPEKSDVQVLVSFDFNKHKTFDNGLPNFGRVLVIEYAEALNEGTCLIFGASSTYSMFNYLARFFKRVIFVHSAGSLDPALIALVKPQFVVAQTNARFVIQVPETTFAIQRVIVEKMARLSAAEREMTLKRQVLADEAYLSEIGLSLSVVARDLT